VIGNFLQQRSIRASIHARIAGVVLFGDPKVNPNAAGVHSSVDPSLEGELGARATTAFAPYAPGLRIDSYCRSLDPVCQNLSPTADIGPHMQYVNAEASGLLGTPRTATWGYILVSRIGRKRRPLHWSMLALRLDDVVMPR